MYFIRKMCTMIQNKVEKDNDMHNIALWFTGSGSVFCKAHVFVRSKQKNDQRMRGMRLIKQIFFNLFFFF